MTTTMLLHDLKSPIAALDTLIYSVADRLAKDELDLAQVAITKIKDKFKQLKHKKPKNSEEHKEWVDVVDLVQEVINEKKVLYFGRKVSLNLQLKESFFSKLFLQPLEFKRVISNLIENAREALPSGGNIVIRLFTYDGFLHIQVRDNGEGMDPDILRLVQKTGGTFNKPEGSGHGLQHAKWQVQEWGGALTIDSLQGIGSIVTLKIPITQNYNEKDLSGPLFKVV